MSSPVTVTLLSDLGVADETVGVLHAILADLAPGVQVNDLTHAVTPGDVRGASVALARAVGYLPEGVVVAAVDAGIDAVRPCVAISVAGGRGVFLAPDNGVLAPAVAIAGGAEAAYVLDRPDWWTPSPGALWPCRDVLVPVAAALATGATLSEVGTPIDADRLLPGVVPLSRLDGDQIVADVIGIDRRGGCQLNLDPDELNGWGDAFTVRAGEVSRVVHRVPTVDPMATATTRRAAATSTPPVGDDGGAPSRPSTFPAGSLGAVVDAFGTISIVGAQRSAAAELELAIGDQVWIARLDAADSGARRSGLTTNVSLRRGPSAG